MSEHAQGNVRDNTQGSFATSPTGRQVALGLRRRYAAERRIRLYGITAIIGAAGFLVFLLASIGTKGYSAFLQARIAVDITFEQSALDPDGTGSREVLYSADYGRLLKQALREAFPEATSRRDKRQLYKLPSNGAIYELRNAVLADPDLVGARKTVWITASSEVDTLIKGRAGAEAAVARIGPKAKAWIETLQTRGQAELAFNSNFFTAGDSRDPEQAGILGALVGSLLTLLVTLALSFPIGVMTAVYLEEFAPKNRWTDLIEININNLAAVPSIVFGLLGLAVILNFFGVPRSAPLAGGIVLALMTLPTIIIAGRATLQAVPPSIREAALGVGASRMQAVLHHVLPLAMPGMLTGTIIGMARALGETAPLLMIGMVAFIVDIPGGITDPATVLPVQIYLWADSPERAFIERMAAAILVLLAFLVTMNLAAQILRRKLERRW